jgi:hypothetical protein
MEDLPGSVLGHLSNRLLDFGEVLRELGHEVAKVAKQLDDQAAEIRDLKAHVREQDAQIVDLKTRVGVLEDARPVNAVRHGQTYHDTPGLNGQPEN